MLITDQVVRLLDGHLAKPGQVIARYPIGVELVRIDGNSIQFPDGKAVKFQDSRAVEGMIRASKP